MDKFDKKVKKYYFVFKQLIAILLLIASSYMYLFERRVLKYTRTITWL